MEVAGIVAQLTKRQQQVLGLKAQGMTYRQIARELSISPRTAERHATIARERTGRSTIQLAVAVAVSTALKNQT